MKFKFEDILPTSGRQRSTFPQIERVAFEDIRQLHTVIDKAFEAIHALELNCDVLAAMTNDCQRLKLFEGPNADELRYSNMEAALESWSHEQLFFKKSLQSLCTRAQQISQVVSALQPRTWQASRVHGVPSEIVMIQIANLFSVHIGIPG